MAWRRPKVKGASAAPKINESKPNAESLPMILGPILEDREPCRGMALEIMTPPLRREPDSERAEARK
eukprot:8244688-Pyramimonas_sp.AAC.1